jgi:hypothetical protein
MSWLQVNAKQKMTTYVESDVYPHDSEVAPMMAIENVRIRLQKLVCSSERADSTTTRGVRIRDISAKVVDVLAEVLLTGLT